MKKVISLFLIVFFSLPLTSRAFNLKDISEQILSYSEQYYQNITSQITDPDNLSDKIYSAYKKITPQFLYSKNNLARISIPDFKEIYSDFVKLFSSESESEIPSIKPSPRPIVSIFPLFTSKPPIVPVDIVNTSTAPTFTEKQITAIKSLFHKLLLEITSQQDNNPNPLSLLQLRGDIDSLQAFINRTISSNVYSAGSSASNTARFGSTNDEIIGTQLTIDNIFISGNSISATSGNVELPATIKFNSVAYTFPSADGSSSQVLSTNGSGVLTWATASAGVSSNSLDFDEIVNSLTLDANLTITPAGFKIGIGAAPTTLFEVQGTASASYLLTGNTLQVGGYSSVSYNRFGTAITSEAHYISTSNDLLVSGDLEGRGSISFAGPASFSNTLWVGTNGSTGSVGIGTNIPVLQLNISAASSAGMRIQNTGTVASYDLFAADDSGVQVFNFRSNENNKFAFKNASDVNSFAVNTTLGTTYTGSNIELQNRAAAAGSKAFIGTMFNYGSGLYQPVALGAIQIGALSARLADFVIIVSDADNWVDADERLRITSAGLTGIGTTAPKAFFSLVDTNVPATAASSSLYFKSSQTIGTVASISATSLTSGNVLQLTVPASSSASGNYFLVRDVNGVVYASLSSGGRFSIRRTMFSHGADTTNCTGIGAPSGGCVDYAENYPTQDATIEAGDLVTIDLNNPQFYVARSAKAYDQSLIGIVSTNPAVLISGTNVKLGDEANNFKEPGNVAVALSGRVPVKVSFENGDIKKGDYLTSSSIPGKATKAIKSGRVVGMALEDANSSSGDNTVLTFINPHWLEQSLDIDNAVSNESNIISKLLTYLKEAILNVKKLVADSVEVKDGVTTHDRATGESYCIFLENGQVKTEKGECLPARTTDKPVEQPSSQSDLSNTPSPEINPTDTPIPDPTLDLPPQDNQEGDISSDIPPVEQLQTDQ